MLYVTVILSFLIASAIVYGLIPYVGLFANVILVIGVPTLLCMNIDKICSQSLWQPVGLERWQQVALASGLAGVYVGFLCRQFILYSQGDKAESANLKVQSLTERINRLESQVQKLNVPSVIHK